MKMKAEAEVMARKETERLNKLPKIQREMIELRLSQGKDRDVFKIKSKLRLGIRKKDILRVKELSPLKVPVFTLENNYTPPKYDNGFKEKSEKNYHDNHFAIDKNEVFHAVDEINLKKFEVVSSLQDVDRTIHQHHYDIISNDHIDDKLQNAINRHSYNKKSSDPIYNAINNVHNTFPQFSLSAENSLYSLEDSLTTRNSTRSKIYPQLQVNILKRKKNISK